jgi:phage anti-repressor protein
MKILFRNKQDLFNKIRDLYVETDGIIKMEKMKQNTNSYIELAKYVARTECEFSDKELSYIERFWKNTFNKEWIYLSKELIVDEIGFKNSKDTMNDFYNKFLYRNFVLDLDYKEIVNTDINIYSDDNSNFNKNNSVKTSDISIGNVSEQTISDKTNKNSLKLKNSRVVNKSSVSRGGSNKKEYMITGECFKNILMLVQTENGKTIRKYYVKVEQLASKTYQTLAIMTQTQLSLSLQQLSIKDNELSIKDNELSIKEKELSLERSRNLKLSKFVNNYKDLVKEEVIYINTTLKYAKHNRFKVGGVGNKSLLNSRLCTYNTGKSNKDLQFYTYIRNVNSYRVIEDQLKAYLPMFLEAKNKEMFHIHYEELVLILDTIIDNIDKGISYINANHERIMKRTIDEKFIPKNIYENELSIEYYSNGRPKISKIDISQLSDNEVEEKILEFIQTFKEENLNITNDQQIAIKWSDFAKYLETKCKIKRSILKKSLDKYLVNTNVTMIYR